MTTDFTSIPVIDLGAANDLVERQRIVAELRHVLLNVGFLYVRGHGVPKTVIRDLVKTLPVLFNLSSEVKEEVALQNSPHFLGYSAAGAETTAGKIDCREQFELATELEDDWGEARPLAERLRVACAYPSLRPIVEAYINALTRLSEDFLELVAEALYLPSHRFHPFLSDQHRLKLVQYPGGLEGGQGVGPHKDSSGWWTFLLQASPPHVKGLQVVNRSGDWIDVPNIPGTFVVNIGQGFEVVTNGVCKATTHRVLSSPEERYSVPFFQGLRQDLTKDEATNTLRAHFERGEFRRKDEI
ncbi:hypothetical protein E8E11_002092 [Didymella keratinophila]|nr:hypothetical protein E8E11_002092 [Didymella keratinophila]